MKNSNKTYKKFNISNLKIIFNDEDLYLKMYYKEDKINYGIVFNDREHFDLFREYF